MEEMEDMDLFCSSYLIYIRWPIPFCEQINRERTATIPPECGIEEQRE